MLQALVVATVAAAGALAQSTTATSPVATATFSPTTPLTATIPSQSPLPPKQAWCPSEIFCAGSLLQTVNVASVYTDPKTFVDKPTSGKPQAVLAAFKNITTTSTEQDVENFVATYFTAEGQELEALTVNNFTDSPSFLNNVTDPLVKAFAKTVHGFWANLIRGTNSSTLCDGVKCESSLIPLNHTFVVPGGRFREQYYWDSFWIVEGLLESQLYDIANATLQNFMDELEHIGFIPNGGRIYYLNRSQPPLFIQMLARYVSVTNDTAILKRALPLAEKELTWWQTNRQVSVKSPFSNKTYSMYHYAVNNSAPRPESYLTDYNTASGLNETAREALWAELASGAETGWDYTTRWLAPGSSNLTTLNVRKTVAVDLNSILYKNHVLLAGLYGTVNSTAISKHRDAAANLKAGILDLFWDSSKLAFYDFNLATGQRNSVFSVATFYPFWSGIIPANLTTSNVFGVFSAVNLVLNRYNGTFPTTFIDTGLQWDAPNAWPPHQYIVLSALRALPSNLTSGPLPSPSNGQNTFSLVPSGQLGIEEAQLPGQPVSAGQNSTNADLNKLSGTVVNGGNVTDGEGWSKALERMLANRYFTSALCSWHATGGSIPNVLPRLSDQELNVTQSVSNTGNMFEKFSNLDVDSAGRGGEYTVQAGFGWTNGVLLWVASNYGNVLAAPQCPDLLASAATQGGGGGGGNAGGGGGGGNGGGAGAALQTSVSTILIGLMIFGVSALNMLVY